MNLIYKDYIRDFTSSILDVNEIYLESNITIAEYLPSVFCSDTILVKKMIPGGIY